MASIVWKLSRSDFSSMKASDSGVMISFTLSDKRNSSAKLEVLRLLLHACNLRESFFVHRSCENLPDERAAGSGFSNSLTSYACIAARPAATDGP